MRCIYKIYKIYIRFRTDHHINRKNNIARKEKFQNHVRFEHVVLNNGEYFKTNYDENAI
jgi:hypothetical protein